jgi:hypothetical protein
MVILGEPVAQLFCGKAGRSARPAVTKSPTLDGFPLASAEMKERGWGVSTRCRSSRLSADRLWASSTGCGEYVRFGSATPFEIHVNPASGRPF